MSLQLINTGTKPGDKTGDKLYIGGDKINDNFNELYDKYIPVNDKDDFPTAAGGVITLEDNVAYLIKGNVDLQGDRLVGGQNTAILGITSELSTLTSTGLAADYLITSVYTITLKNITITAQKAINLDGLGNTMALDWEFTNFTNCPEVGIIKDCTNFIYNTGAFLSSTGLVFQGSIGTIAFNNSLFVGLSTGTIITLPSTLTITRRFRINYSSIVSFGSSVGIDANVAMTIPDESYILDTVNFSGGATYVTGIDDMSNKALFINCVGINNTSTTGQLTMNNNATATVISVSGVFYKVAGTTVASPINSKFLHSDNRLTCDATIKRKYGITAIVSFTAGNSQECRFGFFDSQISGVIPKSISKTTTRSNGKSENIVITDIIEMEQGDYLEVFCANDSATTDIVVTDLNFVVYEIL